MAEQARCVRLGGGAQEAFACGLAAHELLPGGGVAVGLVVDGGVGHGNVWREIVNGDYAFSVD